MTNPAEASVPSEQIEIDLTYSPEVIGLNSMAIEVTTAACAKLQTG
jgi:hypothetical protein